MKKRPLPDKELSPRRKLIRLVGLLLILLLSITYLVLHISEWADTPMIKETAFRLVFRRFRGDFRAEKTTIDLRKTTFEGWRVRARDAEGRQVAETPHAKVKMNLLPLFWLVVKIERVEIDKPIVHLWTDPDRVFIWKKFKLPPKRTRRFNVRVGTIAARDGTFTYDYYPEPRPVHVRLEGINGRAEFIEKTPNIEATAKRLHLRFPGFDHWFRDIQVEGIADEAFAEVRKLTATFLGMPLEIKGRLDGFKRKNPRMNLTIHAKGSIGDLLRYFRYEKNPPGPFELEARVTGLSDDYRVRGVFTSVWGVVEGQRYDDAWAAFAYRSRDRTVRLKSFRLRMYGAHIEGEGAYEIDTGEFSATGKIRLKNRVISYRAAGSVNTSSGVIAFSDLEFWTPYARLHSKGGTWATKTGGLSFAWSLVMSNMLRELPHWGVSDLGGSLALAGRLTGTLRTLRAEASGKVRNLAWFKIRLGGGPVSATLRGGTLEALLKTSAGKMRLNGSARVKLFRNGAVVDISRTPLAFRLDATGVKLTPEVFGTDLSGVVSGILDASGTPCDIAGRGRVEFVGVKAWGQSAASVQADVLLNSKGITFNRATVALPGGDKGRGKLNLDWNLNYSLRLTSDKLRLSSLDVVADSGRPITGMVSVELAGRGNFHRPRISGEAVFSSLKYADLDLEGAQIEFQLDDDVVTVIGSQPWGITVRGGYNLGTGAFIDFEIAFNQTDLLPFCTWYCVADMSGWFTGFLTLNGGEAGWDDVDYRLFVTELNVEYRGEEIRNSLPIQIEVGPSGGVEEIHLFGDPGRLDVMGTLNSEEVWDVDVIADIDLGTIPRFVSSVRRASGRLKVNTHLVGPSEELGVRGEMSVKADSVRVRGYNAEFTNLDIVLGFKRGRVEFREFKGNVGEDGKFNLGGKAFLEGTEITAVDFALDAERVPIRSAGTYRAVVSPDLTLKGTPDELSLEGQIVVDEGRYTRDVRIERQIVEVKRETAPPRRLPKWLENLKLNVRIVDEGNFLIKNNLAEVPLMINLKIEGTPTSPVVEGEVEGVGGKIMYGGREFELVRGRLDFANPVEINPFVDVFARTVVSDYEIRLYLKGPLNHMKLSLESTPSLDDQDIISLIAFNKTVDELSEGQYHALANLPLFFSKDVTKVLGTPLEDFSGIDIFTIEARENAPGAKVTLGKQLSKRLEVEYSSEMGGEFPLQETRLIYKLTDHIWLQGAQNSLGVYSFRLNFQFLIR